MNSYDNFDVVYFSWAAARGSYLHSHRMMTPCTRANSYDKNVDCFWWVGLSILASSLRNKSCMPVGNTGFIIGRQPICRAALFSFPALWQDIHVWNVFTAKRYLPPYSWACNPSTRMRSHRPWWKIKASNCIRWGNVLCYVHWMLRVFTWFWPENRFN